MRLAADYERLKFLRVLRHYGTEAVTDTAQVIAPSSPSLPLDAPLPDTPSADE